MDHKPSFFKRLMLGYLKKNLLFSEIFFWQLLIGIISMIPHNEQALTVIGFCLGLRILTVILFLLPKYFFWLLGLLDVGERADQPVVTQP